MALGLVLIGMMAGLLAAAGALVVGAGVWVALAAYSGGGALGLLLGVVLALLPRPSLTLGTPSRA